MSFSKAKIQRFNDIKPIAPGPTAYNVVVKDKIKSFVTSQMERFTELRSPTISETGSTHSVPCRFKTPTLPKQKKTTTSFIKSKELFPENFDSEALREKIVECENKDTFIKSLTEETEILKDKLSNLYQQKEQLDSERQKIEELVINLKTDHKNEIKKLTEEFEEALKIVAEEKIKVNNEIVSVKEEYEQLKEANRKEMNELKNNCDKFNVLYNKSVEECNELLEEKNTVLANKEHELRALENTYVEIQRKHSMEIEKLQKVHQIEIQDIEFEILKTMTELQKEKEEASRKIKEIETLTNKTIADLKSKFEREREQLLIQYEDKIKEVTEQVKEAQARHMNEKLDEIETIWKQKLEIERQQSNAILQECQTIGEYNVIQCELEKKDIETKLSEKTKELEVNLLQYVEIISNYEDLKNKYDKLQFDLSSTVNDLKESNDSLNNELNSKNKDLEKYLEENRTYLITIKSSQNTIEVLKRRLINSDRDVEQLKKEVSDNEAKILKYENKCVQLMTDLKKAQDCNEELEMQHESAIKLNTSEIHKIKAELLEKVESYRREVEKVSKKSREDEEVKREIIQQLHEAHKLIDRFKMEFECFDMINSQYEFEVEQSQNELEDYRIRELEWNVLKEKLEHTVKELEGRLGMKQEEVDDFKKQISQLQDKCESYFQHYEYYKDKVAEYERELDETGNIHKKYIEQSGRYDELLQKFEQLEKENMENEKKIIKLSKNCQEKESYAEKCNQEREAYDALLRRYEQLEKENSWNKKKTDEQPSLKDRLDQVEQERDTLLGRIQYLEEELRQISDKYADLTGHHNNKQKIKHLVDLKAKNTELIESNTDLELKMRSQLKVIEKLKKENVELRKCARKSKLHPEDKENIGSPNRSLNSSRVESPFRERN